MKFYAIGLLGMAFFASEALAAGVPTAVVISAMPNAPSNLTAVSTSPTQVVLTWTDNSNNEDGFSVERKAGVGGTYAEITTVGANIATFIDNAAAQGTLYFYQVRSFIGIDYSSYSNEASATTQTVVVPPPPVSGGGGGGGVPIFSPLLPISTSSNTAILATTSLDGLLTPPLGKVDLDGNGKVDIIDLSLLAYWFKRPNSPAKFDLNSDGKVNITDLSIMAYYWGR